MNIIIKTTNIELTETLEKWVRMRLEPLTKFDKFLETEDVEAWVEIGRTTHHHRKGDVFRAEAQIRMPGKSIRVEATSHNLKKSINEIKDKLQREIKEYKERKRVQG